MKNQISFHNIWKYSKIVFLIINILLLSYIVYDVSSDKSTSKDTLSPKIVNNKLHENITVIKSDTVRVANTIKLDDIKTDNKIKETGSPNNEYLKNNFTRISNLNIAEPEKENDDMNNSVLLSSNYKEGEEYPKVLPLCDKTGYTKTKLNIRKEPSTSSDIIDTVSFNTELKYSSVDDKWAITKYKGEYCYVYKKYISDNKVHYKEKSVIGDRRKSYMDYRAITLKSSLQYKIQQKHAYTGSNGVRMANGRYLIALGSYYTHDVGRYVDLILKNGTVIECIIGDCKKNMDTVDGNSMGVDGGVAEFIVDTPKLNSKVRRTGDVSFASSSWSSNVKSIKIYNKNLLH